MGGGGFGPSLDETMEIGSRESRGERAEVFAGSTSVSVSEPEASSSQLSATGLDLGFDAGFWGTLVESLRWESVDAISDDH